MSKPIREEFAPKWYSIFFNPYYIIRGKPVQSNKA